MSENATLIPAPPSRVQTAPLALNGLEEVLKLGQVLAQSGFFSDAKTAAQAVVKVLAGRELGFATIASMVGVHIIEGKPSVGAHLMASMIKRSDRYDYGVNELTREVCDLSFWGRHFGEGHETRKGAPGWVKVGTVRMTMQEAVESGLAVGKDGRTIKANWSRTPDDMLFARCVSKGYRRYCPDLTGGVLAYDPDELDGESAEARPLPAPAPALPGPVEVDATYTVTNSDGSQTQATYTRTVSFSAEEPRPNSEAPPPPAAEPLTEQEVAELTALARTSNPQRSQPLSMGQAKAILAVLGVPVLAKAPLEKLDWLRQAFTTGLCPTPQVDRISSLVTELKLDWEKFRARLRTTFGAAAIAHLLPAQADQVEQGLLAEKVKRQQPATSVPA